MFHLTRHVNKTAIVTASTAGIGLAIAQRLACEGANVVVSSRKQKNVDEAVNEIQEEMAKVGSKGKVVGLECHVGEHEARKKLIKFTLDNFGSLDYLVSNAAVNPFAGKTIETPESAWDKIFDTNVKAAFLLSQEAVPHIKKGGSIVYVSSVGGYLPFPMIGAYSISKTALFGLTRTLSMELAPKGIRVNCLAPGVIETKFSSYLTDPKNNFIQSFLKTVPLGRVGEPKEMAGVVSFLLCQEEASYVTGETIAATGGMNSHL